MKRIPLTQGKFALVDDADFDWLNQWKWHAHWDTWNWYAQRTGPRGKSGKRPTIPMHAVIAGCSAPDHKNRNTLDNRRSNLRPATASQNGMNRNFQSINTSGARGVSWDKRQKRWSAQIRFQGKLKWLGYFSQLKAAASAYKMAASQLFGEFANR